MLSHSRIKAKHERERERERKRERERARIQACQQQDKISYKRLHPNNQQKGKMQPNKTRKAQKVQTNT